MYCPDVLHSLLLAAALKPLLELPWFGRLAFKILDCLFEGFLRNKTIFY